MITFVQCSPHPRKRKLATPLQPERNGEDHDPQASTSKYQPDAEFVPVGCDEATKRSPQIPPDNPNEKDPLLEENHQREVDPISTIRIKSEPASEDEDRVLGSFSSGNQYLERPSERAIQQQNLVVVSFIFPNV